jgi:hypothetical protein
MSTWQSTRIAPELRAVAEEYHRAKQKHGEFTMDGKMGHDVIINPSNNLLRLAALMEEVGEVSEHFTYDKVDDPGLRKELIQVANVALTWASILRGYDFEIEEAQEGILTQ